MTTPEQSNPTGTPDTTLLDERIKKHMQGLGGGGGGPGEGGELRERVARLEGVFESFKTTVEGLRHSQNLIVAIVSLLAVVLIGLSIYQMQRIDQLNTQFVQTNDRVSELPSKVSDDLRNLTQTLAATITAARQPEPPAVPIQPKPAKPK